MTSLADIRRQYPQYDDLPDEELVSAFYQKFYSDMPREEFNATLNYTPSSVSGVPDLNGAKADGSLFKLPDVTAPGYLSGVSQRAKDLFRAGGEGLSLGLYGRGAAKLDSWWNNRPYEDAWKDQQKEREASAAHLDAVNPGTYKATELAGSLLPMLATGGAAAVPESAPLWMRGAGQVAEGATSGAASAYGHGEDPLKGAAVGAAGGAVPSAAAAATKLAPWAGRVGGAAQGLFGKGGVDPVGGWAGWELGGKTGNMVQNVLQTTTQNSPTGRDLLALLSSTPGRFYGWATGQ